MKLLSQMLSIKPADLAPQAALTLFYHDMLGVGLGLLLVAAAWALRSRTRDREQAPAAAPVAARRLLAWGLGALWILDGLLQIQPEMVTNFVNGMLRPLISGQPGALAATLTLGLRMWAAHPVLANVMAAYTQIVIGVLILFGGDGRLRRVALLASLAWGLVVWIFGEAMGGIFVGGTWLAGTPGSATFYMAGAVLLLLPAERWRQGGWLGTFAAAMGGLWFFSAVLQAWPSAGFWTAHGLAGVVASMAQQPQPVVVAASLRMVARVLSRHSVLWNGGMVAAMAALGIAWLHWPRSRYTWTATVVWALLTWWAGQDFGVLGGMGTDPNSGPVLILLIATYVSALTPAGRTAQLPTTRRARAALPARAVGERAS